MQSLNCIVARNRKRLFDMGTRGRIPKSGSVLKENPLKITEEQIIKGILSSLGTDQKVPLDIDAIIEHCGLTVKMDNQLDSEISGYLKYEDDRWVIGVNAKHAPVRQRFTKAHELGHYFMHCAGGDGELVFEDKILFRDENFMNPKERQANKFAADLLMPEELVREEIKKGQKSVQNLAAHFKVSVIAMKFQLLSMGYEIK